MTDDDAVKGTATNFVGWPGGGGAGGLGDMSLNQRSPFLWVALDNQRANFSGTSALTIGLTDAFDRPALYGPDSVPVTAPPPALDVSPEARVKNLDLDPVGEIATPAAPKREIDLP